MINMTAEELKKFNKETEKIVVDTVKGLHWYQVKSKPSKAGILVEDIIPILTDYVNRERLRQYE